MKILLVFISTFLFANCFAQTELSYRYAQSSVKNQAARGTCTAFGVCAAFEVCPGIPSNLSEQYLYARIKYDHYSIFQDKTRLFSQGEFLKNYIFTISTFGLISEERMPYNGSQPMATNDEDLFNQYKNITRNVSPQLMEEVQKESYLLSKDQYEYLSGSEAKSIENIKQALRNGVKAIPVCYGIHPAQWQDEMLNYSLDPLIDLDGIMYVAYNGKWANINDVKKNDPFIENKILEEQVKIYPRYVSAATKQPSYTDGGHCVTIVGYNKDGFIIKNSWGTSWADAGYATVSYNFHNVFANEALILKNFYATKYAVASPFDFLLGDQIRLKTMPIEIRSQKAMSFCFFYEGPKVFPEFEKIEIRFFEKRGIGVGKGNYLGNCFPEISENSFKIGYLTELPSSIAYEIANGKELVTEVEFTYNVGLRKVTNVYGNLKWKNQTIQAGIMGYRNEEEE